MPSRANAGTARDDARRDRLRTARSSAGRSIALAADAAEQRDLLELGTAAVSDAADFEVVANRGAINGYAELNSDGVIPAAQMGGATATTSTIIENRTSDPGAPEDGRIWLRTDL